MLDGGECRKRRRTIAYLPETRGATGMNQVSEILAESRLCSSLRGDQVKLKRHLDKFDKAPLFRIGFWVFEEASRP